MAEPDKGDIAQIQSAFAAHIRNPAGVPVPEGVEQRRMKIYNDLIYNNVEGFLRSGFPVLCSLYRDEDWHRLVRSFVTDYRCESPYFLEISQEFLNYLMQQYQALPTDPDFMLELAHYEWVELALDVSTENLPAGLDMEAANLLEGTPVLSPLVMSLQYRYPVHQIGPGFEPSSPPSESTFLIVYRNREEEVKFMESNAATARLLDLLRDNEAATSGSELLEALAREMNADSITSVVSFGSRMLEQFLSLDIVAGSRL